MKTIKGIIGKNLLTNSPINIANVSAAEDIFGPDEGRLHRKTVRTKPWEAKSIHNNLPMEPIKKYQSVILSAD